MQWEGLWAGLMWPEGFVLQEGVDVVDRVDVVEKVDVVGRLAAAESVDVAGRVYAEVAGVEVVGTVEGGRQG